jgi:cytochrome c5
VNGGTFTESLPTPAAARKAEREVAEFRNFQELSREFVETNAKICHLRPVEGQPETEQEKKRPKRSVRKSRAK